jgi:V/A-type H+-transporting ATPase subunit I
MKQITLLISSNDREAALKTLREIGVLHIEDIVPPGSEDIQHLEAGIESADRVIALLSEQDAEQESLNFEDAGHLTSDIIDLVNSRESHVRDLEEKLDVQRWFERWGDISYQTVKALSDAGVYVRLYVTDKNGMKRIPAEVIVHIAREEGGTHYLGFFSDDPDERLDFREEQIPQVESSEINAEIGSIQSEIKKIDASIDGYARYASALADYRDDLSKRLEFNHVKYGMGDAAEISYLKGYCPEDTVGRLEDAGVEHGWGLIIQEPEDPAQVPTLTRNPKWLKMIQPLFDFMGTLPGYKEQDVSLVFLLFFSLFYAMLVGDAGYGLVFLLGTLYLGKKKKDASRDFLNLMYVLSFSTIIWGLLSGTWFGSKTLAQLPFLKIFIIDQLDSFGEQSQSFVMQFSFIVGVVHLSVARLLAAIKKINSMPALAEIGWILILWAVYFAANFLVLGKEMPGFAMWLLLIGVVVVLLFANFQKNILKGILLSLSNLPLDVISSFSDVVSYIRLFAVGFATVIVASSFNSMAVGSGIDNVLSGIIAAVVLFLGHTLNIALCGMSVLVHGVRLNMLEFSGHVGVQWTGKPYKPFKE